MIAGNKTTIGSPKGDVPDTEGDGVCFGVAGLGVFADPQEIVESNVGEVGNGLALGTVGRGLPLLTEDVLGDGYWDCELGR